MTVVFLCNQKNETVIRFFLLLPRTLPSKSTMCHFHPASRSYKILSFTLDATFHDGDNMQPPLSSPTRSLQKSLRLPRSSTIVAHWLFDQPHLSFQDNAPLLSALSFSGSMTVHVRDFWTNFGQNFDPLSSEQVDLNGVSPATSEGSLHSDSTANNIADPKLQIGTVMDLNMILTPAMRASPDVLLGYVLCNGPSFDPESPLQACFFRGRTNIIGRFAFDMDNDHIILLFHGVTPQATALIDVTTNGLSRNRFIYAIPYSEYGPDDLPSQVLSFMASSELRSPLDKLCAHPSIFSGSLRHQSAAGDSNLSPQMKEEKAGENFQVRNGSDNLSAVLTREKLSISRANLKDIESLVSDLDFMTPAWEGSFNGENVLQWTSDLSGLNIRPTQHIGSVISQYFIPSQNSRRHLIADAWCQYSSQAFGMRSQRRGVRLLFPDNDESYRSDNKPTVLSSSHHNYSSTSSSLRLGHGRVSKTRRLSNDCSSIVSGKSYQAQNSNYQALDPGGG